MSQERINSQTKPSGSNTALIVARPQEQIVSSPKVLGRNALRRMHAEPITSQELGDTAVSKGFQIASGGIKDSLESGFKLLSSASNGALDFTNASVKNKNIRSILLAVVGSIFGISSIKGLLGAPKVLSKKDSDAKQAPMLIKAAKWLAGGSIAFGAFKTITGAASMSNPALIAGIAVFVALKTIISGYEKDNGLTAKLLEMLGLRTKVKEIVDDAKLDNVVPN